MQEGCVQAQARGPWAGVRQRAAMQAPLPPLGWPGAAPYARGSSAAAAAGRVSVGVSTAPSYPTQQDRLFRLGGTVAILPTTGTWPASGHPRTAQRRAPSSGPAACRAAAAPCSSKAKGHKGGGVSALGAAAHWSGCVPCKSARRPPLTQNSHHSCCMAHRTKTAAPPPRHYTNTFSDCLQRASRTTVPT